jgi:hypothetical protein
MIPMSATPPATDIPIIELLLRLPLPLLLPAAAVFEEEGLV